MATGQDQRPEGAPATPILTVDDYERIARDALSEPVYDFFAGGAVDERTLARNRAAFERWLLRPRYLRGAAAPDPSTRLLGVPLAFPVLVAPVAYQRLLHPEGELATRRAAARVGTVMVVSSTAADLLEDVAAAAEGPAWWQLYLWRDRGAAAELLARVREAGYGALVWTVDLTTWGRRLRDLRTGFEVPPALVPSAHDPEPDLRWEDLAWIRERAAGLPVLVKGLLTAEDARLALEHGADGVVVSNHGGRQLDAVVGSLEALPEIVETVQGRVPVLMDGGVRRGTDVLVALALGASAVLVGRPAAWGLAAEGERGVAGALSILRDELESAMALTGCRTLADVGPALVRPAG
ncbi:MAG: alpha-hydroxy-acid oxidizing enzyme [Actinomycetota bacterium]|jgi:isopentenyl diphosphate isomerase/L-lactate dehydrogenase-like FMN-dependent dehydrogenase|nr:MAG: alpha-hydroxy-acid oxidizing enzyme [Actinomycetota bacterium]